MWHVLEFGFLTKHMTSKQQEAWISWNISQNEKHSLKSCYSTAVILALGLGQLEEKFQGYQNLLILADLCTNHLSDSRQNEIRRRRTPYIWIIKWCKTYGALLSHTSLWRAVSSVWDKPCSCTQVIWKLRLLRAGTPKPVSLESGETN